MGRLTGRSLSILLFGVRGGEAPQQNADGWGLGLHWTLLHWTPTGTRSVGHPLKRWTDDICQFARIHHDLDWVLMAQSREAWAAEEQHFVHAQGEEQ